VALMTPSCPGDSGPLLGAEDAAIAAAACRKLGAAAAIVTLGPGGVLIDDGLGARALPAVPAPHVVDGTGAGDVLTGTIAARLALGDDLAEAAALGLAAASLSVAGQGGTGSLAPLDAVRAHMAA
jgi:2-dehydro-3-deoxygluconokinase